MQFRNVGSLLVMALIVFPSPFAIGKDLKATMHDLATDKVLFEGKLITDKKDNGSWVRTNHFLNMDGELVVKEMATAGEGGKLESYTVEQLQINEVGKIRVEGDSIFFDKTNSEGETTTEKESLVDNFVVGPTLVEELKENWDRMLAGEKINVRFGVWDRQETVGFRLYKSRQVEENGKEVVEVIMNPSSWFIRQLVNDLVFTFDAESKDLLSIKGRVAPKIKKGDDWKDLDAYTVYTELAETDKEVSSKDKE